MASKSYLKVKYLLDLVCAVLMSILLAPIFVFLYITVLIFMGRPVFFRQERPGLNNKSFTLLKFRSMTIPSEISLAESDENRLTKIGKFLRSTSLDELPSLFNVIRGDMSFVGPRPLLTEYLKLYSPEQLSRHSVRPGITGLAQVSGRNSIDWSQKFEFDIFYVNNLSFALDVQIIFRTLVTVFSRKGISSAGHATMPKFTKPTDWESN